MIHIQSEVTQPFTKEAAATQLGVSVATINRLVYSGRIESLKIGRNVRIEKEALEAYKSSNPLKQTNG